MEFGEKWNTEGMTLEECEMEMCSSRGIGFEEWKYGAWRNEAWGLEICN